MVDALCYLDTLQWYDSPFAVMMLNFLQLVFLLCSMTYVYVSCPREEYLVPPGSCCRSAGRVPCTDVLDERTFEMIFAARKGYETLVSRFRRHRFGRFGLQPANSTILLWKFGPWGIPQFFKVIESSSHSSPGFHIGERPTRLVEASWRQPNFQRFWDRKLRH